MARKRVHRGNMTPAEKVTLYVYPALSLVVGAAFMFTPREKLMLTPALRIPDEVTVPISYWGFLFFAVGVMLTYSLILGRFYWVFLSGFVGLMVMWSLVQIGAGLFGQASYSGWAWAAGHAAFGWASIKGLTTTPEPPSPLPPAPYPLPGDSDSEES